MGLIEKAQRERTYDNVEPTKKMKYKRQRSTGKKRKTLAILLVFTMLVGGGATLYKNRNFFMELTKDPEKALYEAGFTEMSEQEIRQRMIKESGQNIVGHPKNYYIDGDESTINGIKITNYANNDETIAKNMDIRKVKTQIYQVEIKQRLMNEELAKNPGLDKIKAMKRIENAAAEEYRLYLIDQVNMLVDERQAKTDIDISLRTISELEDMLTVALEQPDTEEVDKSYQLKLIGEEDAIFKSALVRPGDTVYRDDLDEDLPNGEYKAYVYVTNHYPDERTETYAAGIVNIIVNKPEKEASNGL